MRGVEYTFLYGTAGELGAVTNENLADQRFLDRMSFARPSKGGIVVPTFVGLYQQLHITEDERSTYRVLLQIQEVISSVLISQRSLKTDMLSPYLIHLGYDSTLYDVKTARLALNDSIGRIEVSQTTSMPRFTFKPIGDFNKIISIMAGEMAAGRDSTDVVKDNKLKMDELRRNLGRFGLTRDEYSLLHCYN